MIRYILVALLIVGVFCGTTATAQRQLRGGSDWPPHPKDMVFVGEHYNVQNTPPQIMYSTPHNKWLVITFFQADLHINNQEIWSVYYDSPATGRVNIMQDLWGQSEDSSLHPPSFNGDEVGIAIPPGVDLIIRGSSANIFSIDVLFTGYLVRD